ncbi:hypothetical protein HanIR_Chr12g0605191 [Helianthus annuus]|nr:hypothetical protein HanIR_Chr12g0605191 [Helianthus annuus]
MLPYAIAAIRCRINTIKLYITELYHRNCYYQKFVEDAVACRKHVTKLAQQTH